MSPSHSLLYIGNEDYCPSCRVLSPILKAEAGDLGLPVTWLDADEDLKEIAPFNVESLPTVIVMSCGHEIGRIVGAYPQAKLREKLKALIC